MRSSRRCRNGRSADDRREFADNLVRPNITVNNRAYGADVGVGGDEHRRNGTASRTIGPARVARCTTEDRMDAIDGRSWSLQRVSSIGRLWTHLAQPDYPARCLDVQRRHDLGAARGCREHVLPSFTTSAYRQTATTHSFGFPATVARHSRATSTPEPVCFPKG
jgi:hypothetical protein